MSKRPASYGCKSCITTQLSCIQLFLFPGLHIFALETCDPAKIYYNPMFTSSTLNALTEFLIGDFSQAINSVSVGAVSGSSVSRAVPWVETSQEPRVTQHRPCPHRQGAVPQGLNIGQSQVVIAMNPINSLRQGKVISQFQGPPSRQGWAVGLETGLQHGSVQKARSEIDMPTA